MNIPLIDLKAQYESLADKLNEATLGILSSANYIMGKKVLDFEKEFADYIGVKHAISVGNGTDALVLALKAMGIGEGSAVVYPKNLEETLSVFGTNGTVVIGGLAANELKTWRFEGEDEGAVKKGLQVEIDSVYGKGHTPLFRDVIEAVNEDRKPYVSGEDAIVPLSIILAAYKSRKTGMPVKFPFTNFSSSDMKE